VFVSSHLMSEMALTADHLVVIGRGCLIAEGPVEELTARNGGQVRVRSPQADRLVQLLAGRRADVARATDGTLTVRGLDAAAIGEVARGARVALHELTPEHASLEETFFELTNDSVEYRAERAVVPQGA
jgi:ABC-2 type transport system ATP-binding protein